jgi:hypothetical protein
LEKKRRKVNSRTGKLLADISRGHEERSQIFQRMAEKIEAVNSHNPVFTFFRSVAQTVTQFPSNIIAETRVKVCQLVGEMETKAWAKQTNSFGVPLSQFFFVISLPNTVLLRSWSCPTSILSVIY